jgi:hypothetical protein
LDDYTEGICEQIDAAFFSADTFHSKKAVKMMEFYLGRWNMELESIKEMLAEMKGEE